MLVTKIVEAITNILDSIRDEPISVHQIVCKTRLHNTTVNAYLEIIEKVQSSGKIKKIVKKSRVFFILD